MADGENLAVVFVHGWSVTHTNTYGAFPERLKAEARRAGGPEIDVRNVWLGKYVSFHDEVRMPDLARAFEAAIRDQLADLLSDGRRFACVTHSTGGPVIRDWWDRFYVSRNRRGACPLSHLIMLAPANFGSALAQLGKERIGRLKSWFQGVEPGTGVLDWLEIGSRESWDLNRRWIVDYTDVTAGRGRTFPFVLTGQCIDHKLYDHVNSYTGEVGSDGVVRVAAANLNAHYVQLVQVAPEQDQRGRRYHGKLEIAELQKSQETAFAIVKGMAHSGADMGIMRSVRNNDQEHATVSYVLDCLRVRTPAQYRALCARFRDDVARVQEEELVESRSRLLLPDHRRVRDPHSMAIFRITDDYGHSVGDYDIVLTAGERESPDRLPVGFIVDKQRNSRARDRIAFYFNHGIMTGREIPEFREHVARDDDKIGLTVHARPETGFVHYARATLSAVTSSLVGVLQPNQTVMVDIVMRRIVHKETFALTRNTDPESFKGVQPGGEIRDG